MDHPIAAIDAIEQADPCQPFVIAQLGQSLDGRIALPSGESKYINGPAALDHLHRLRAAVDAVVIGAGTAITDDPLLTVRRVAGRNPVRVIIDPNGRVPEHLKCLNDGAADVYVLRRHGCDKPLPQGAQRICVPGPDGAFRCGDIINALFHADMRRILIEGGAETVSRFLEERQLDRLHLLIGPVLLGAGRTGINLRPILKLSHALRVSAQLYRFEGGDVLFDCKLSRNCNLL